MPVTLKDIADRTGVSPSVVSTVLSGRDNGTFVSKETRERVLQVAKALNYTPVRSGRPRGSRRLRRQRVEQFIGVWSPALDPVALLSLQQALSHYAIDHGLRPGEELDYGLRLLADDDLPRLDMLGVMGIIVVGDAPLPRTAAAATLPTVIFGEIDDPPREAVMVHTNNFLAGRSVGEYLWGLGHRSVAFMAPAAKQSARVTRNRWQGIQSVWVDHGAPLEACVPAPYDTIAGEDLRHQVLTTTQMLVSPTPPQAIVCFNEDVARFTVQSLAALGMAVPADISVIVFGDAPNGCEAMSPPLTGFRAPSQQLAATAIAQLYRLHYEAGADAPRLGGSDHADLAFTGELIVRDSCRQIPTQQ